MEPTTSAANSMSIGPGFSLIMTILFIGLLAFGAFKGARRGLIRQSIRTGTIITTIIICFIFVAGFVGVIDDTLAGNTVGGVLAEFDAEYMLEDFASDEKELELIMGISTNTARNILMVVSAALIFPFFFTFLFLIISFIFECIYGLVCILFGLSKKDHSRNDRLIGAAIGFVQAFIVSIILFLPLANIFNIMDATVDSIRPIADDDSGLQEFIDDYDENVDPLYCFPLKTTNALGGKLIAKSITTVKIDGEKYDSRYALANIGGIFYDFTTLENADFSEMSKADQEHLRDITDRALDDRLLVSTITGVLQEIGKAYLQLEEDATENGEYNVEAEFYHSFFEIFANSTYESVKADINHALDIYFLVCDEGLIKAMESEDSGAMEDALMRKDESGKTLMKRLIEMLNRHPSTKALVDNLTKLSVSIMMKDNDKGEEVEQIYTEVKSGIGNINEIDSSLSDEQYTEEVHEVINSTLAENNIVLEEDVLDYMSEYVTENYKGKEITDADINDIIFTYYDAVVEDRLNNEKTEG